MKIAVIGSGYVGLVAGACFAELGHQVVLVDNDPQKLAMLKRGQCPIHEEFLPELLERHRETRLNFSEDLTASVNESEVVFIAVGTPPTIAGEADLSFVEGVAREVAGAIRNYKVIVSKSTVPVYTSEWVKRTMMLNGAPENLFEVASNPEFLREGTAVRDFLYPDRIVIGCETDHGEEALRSIYRPLTDGSYYREATAIPGPNPANPPQLIATKPKSAELIKYACNAFLAMKISFINSVATICESVGADIEDVRQGIGTDSRIGGRFLNAGIGYGGSCFPKDLSAYKAVAQECGYDFRLLEEVMQINNEQRTRFIRKIRKALWTLKGKTIAVWGLAFKGGTDDVRESPAIAIVQSLLQEGCKIVAFDPAAMERALEVLSESGMRFAGDAYAACRDADALLVLTDWKEFIEADLARVCRALRHPIVIDGRNLFLPEQMQLHGLSYYSVGRPDVLALPTVPAAATSS